MGQTAAPAQVASMYALLGGVFLIVLGLFRLGFLDNMLARPLLCGLISAVALIIVFEQTDVFFGLQARRDQHSWEKIGYTLEHYDSMFSSSLIIIIYPAYIHTVVQYVFIY